MFNNRIRYSRLFTRQQSNQTHPQHQFWW